MKPRAEDHVCTPADFVVGPVARFEANLAALALLKTLAAEGRPATPDERAVLARFSGFGDSTFEPAFRLSAHRPEDQRLGRARTPPSLSGGRRRVAVS